MGIVFFGSSDFSIPALKASLDSSLKVSLVITTPDRKQGRGLKELPTPIRTFAREKGLPCEAPETLRSEELIGRVRALKPEYFVVSSYGKLIPANWLQIPSRGSFNVHPSLLPKYRGAAPINWPLLNGDTETGMSIIEVAEKLDAGDIFYQQRISIQAEDDALTLTEKLAQFSYTALQTVLDAAARDALKRTAQDETKATYARKLGKEDGKVDWEKPAAQIACMVRGLLPWPTASAAYQNESFQILKARPVSEAGSAKPGEILAVTKDAGLRVQCGSGGLEVLRVRPAGKNAMSGFEFANGRRMQPGMRFS